MRHYEEKKKKGRKRILRLIDPSARRRFRFPGYKAAPNSRPVDISFPTHGWTGTRRDAKVELNFDFFRVFEFFYFFQEEEEEEEEQEEKEEDKKVKRRRRRRRRGRRRSLNDGGV